MDKDTIRHSARRARRHMVCDAGDVECLNAYFTAILPDDTKKTIVGGYYPIGTEIDDLPLLWTCAGLGIKITLPVVNSADKSMGFYPWAIGSNLVVGPYDIPQPIVKARGPYWPDILIAPLLAYDGYGHRLGYGGGYYDRYIAALRAQKKGAIVIGLAYTGQLLDTPLPTEDMDQALDMVITPDGVTKF